MTTWRPILRLAIAAVAPAIFWAPFALAGCRDDGGVLLHCTPQTPMNIEFGPNGDRVAIRTGLTEVSFLSTASWSVTKCRIPSRAFAFVNSGVVCVLGEDGRAYLVNPLTGVAESSFPIPGYATGPPAVCGNYLCVQIGLPDRPTTLTTVLVMDLKGNLLRKFSTLAMGASPAERPLSASQDGRWLVALGWDRAIVYEAGTWRKIADLRGGFSKGYAGGFLTLCTFSSNGGFLYLGNESFQQVVAVGTWKRNNLHPYPGHLIRAALPRPSGAGFLVLLGDGSLRDSSDTLIQAVPSVSRGSAGDCIDAALGPRGLLLTGWENGDIRKQSVTLN